MRIQTYSLITMLLFCAFGHAQEKPPLRWGADPTGGAPFIFEDQNGNLTGFEYDLAEYLAEKLGRTSVMVSGDWANLPQQLKKPPNVEGGVDIILNGYELRSDLLGDYASTRPYYVYRLSLMALKENQEVLGWADLYRPGPRGRKTVGVLGGTVAQQYLENTFGDAIDIMSSQDVANVIKLVNDKRLEATVQDSPAATYFLGEYPKLRTVGEPVRPGFYVIYYRKADKELGEQLDNAIAEGIRDGTFQRIYGRYNLWNDDQERLNHWIDNPWPPPQTVEEPISEDGTEDGENETINPLPRLTWDLVRAAMVTIQLSLLSFPLAVLIGISVAILRVYGPLWTSIPAGIYVEVIRGTPLLLQLFMIYYLVPELLLRSEMSLLTHLAEWLTPFRAGVIGLAINYSAYEAENYRAGLLAVPKGQMEAALSLGFSRYTAIRRIIVPQAVRIVIPPVTNDFIALFKDTSACSIILVVELTRKYNELFNFNRSLIVELAFITAGLYLMMSYPLAILAGRLEKRLAQGTHKQK